MASLWPKWWTIVTVIVTAIASYGLAHTYQQLADCSPENKYARAASDDQITKLRALIVTTLDGRVNVIDANNGKTMWSKVVGNGPLLHSTLGGIDFTHNQMSFRLIPSLDGTLYRFNGHAVEPLPLSADKLLSNSYKLGDDVIISGGKEATTFGIDLLTGEKRYECGFSGCFQNSIETEVVNDSQRHLLMVERHSQVVRAHSPRSGAENWNFEVGEFSVYLVNEDNNCRMASDAEEEHKHEKRTDRFKIIVPEGHISLVDMKDNSEKWSKPFPAPIVSVWELNDRHLQQLDLFSKRSPSDQTLSSIPTIYLGSHLGQIYVQHSRLYNKVLKEITQDITTSNNNLAAITGQNHLAIEWKPQLINSNDQEQELATAVAIVPMSASSLKNGVILTANHGKAKKDQCDGDSNGSSFTIIGEEFNETLSMDNVGMDQVIFVSLWHWWREVLCISVFLAVVINCIAYNLKKKIARCAQRCAEVQSLPTPEESEASADNNEADKRKLTLQISQVTATTGNSTISSTITASSNNSEQDQFISRYMMEFEHVKCLGRGGFGVVFEAKNKIDECSYAIKRIKIKLNSQEKAMREVKALAKLDHPGIVRFYSTWIEKPPRGWQEQSDKELNLTKTDSEVDSRSLFTDTKFTETEPRSTMASMASRTQWAQSKLDDSLRRPVCEDSDSYVFFDGSAKDDDADEDKSNKENQSATEHHISERGPLSASLSAPPSTALSINNLNKPKETESDNVFFQSAYLYIQMQLCKKQTLREWLQHNNSKRESNTILDLFRQIVEAVEYVHDQGLMHRDLKPSNILFASNGAVKIGDFGLVTNVVEETSIRTPTTNNVSIADASGDTPKKKYRMHSHTDNVGTCLYMSPEQIAGMSYSNKVDIFSLGVIYFELLIPFKTDMERVVSLKSARERIFPKNFEKQNKCAHKLLQKLLAHDADTRPTANEIRKELPHWDSEQQVRQRLAQRLRTLSETLDETQEETVDEFD